MKNLHYILFLLIFAFNFTSCGSDDDNDDNGGHTEFSTTSFAYIKYQEGQKYAVTPFFLISSTEIGNLPTASCAIVSYKVKDYDSGINPAENVEFLEKELYQSPNITRGVADVSSFGTEVYPSDFSFDGTYYSYNGQYYAFEDYFGDNWLFATKFNENDNMKVAAYFFYDPEQEIRTTDDAGNPKVDPTQQPENNEIIIDVRFVKNPTSGPSYIAPADNRTKYFAGNLSGLRMLPEIVNDLKDTNETVDLSFYVVPIKFRYIKEKKKTDGTVDKVETILGSWDLNTTGFRYMGIYKEN